MSRILIVDDDQALRRSLCAALSDSHSVREAPDGLKALECLGTAEPELVILDMDMPGLGGMDTLRQIKKRSPQTIVLILTAYATVADAVAAMKEGAYHYLAKPVRNDDLRRMVDRALEAGRMVTEVAYSAPVLKGDSGTALLSRSAGMRKVFDLVEKLARVDTAVLLRGESGTGKEVVARAIHFNSLRKDGRFVAVNLGAIPETLMESELFGHEKGAFTGAEGRKIGKFQYADGGTLFLDEIGDVSPAMQVKLLRFLQEKTFVPVGSNLEIEANVRILAATNRDLESMMARGLFREDLYYRLSVLPIHLPPLRERTEDLDALAAHFIRKFNGVHRKAIGGIDREAMERLRSHAWPGNIRELENVIEHAFVLECGPVITEASLPEHLRSLDAPIPEPDSPPGAEELDFADFKERYEREFIVRALHRFKGRINKTSRHTKISKKTLLRKIEKYGIRPEEFKE